MSLIDTAFINNNYPKSNQYPPNAAERHKSHRHAVYYHQANGINDMHSCSTYSTYSTYGTNEPSTEHRTVSIERSYSLA